LLRQSWLLPYTRIGVAAAALMVCISGTLFAAHGAAPYQSLFRNAIGTALAPVRDGERFPEETYDYGVREAVHEITRTAQPGAAIVSDAPGVVAYYLAHSGRSDLRVQSLSAQGLPRDGRPSFVIVQPEHLTFENQRLVVRLTHDGPPWREFRADDAVAARVYFLPRSQM
jgi:hypothetical protein